MAVGTEYVHCNALASRLSKYGHTIIVKSDNGCLLHQFHGDVQAELTIRNGMLVDSDFELDADCEGFVNYMQAAAKRYNCRQIWHHHVHRYGHVGGQIQEHVHLSGCSIATLELILERLPYTYGTQP